jgi:hypothetical protein
MEEKIINSYCWSIFINTGWIDKKYLIWIANKIKAFEKLTPKEEAIRQEHSEIIEQMLK